MYKRKFTINWPDKTAGGGVSKIKLDPAFDKVPNSNKLVNTKELALEYCIELFGVPKCPSSQCSELNRNICMWDSKGYILKCGFCGFRLKIF